MAGSATNAQIRRIGGIPLWALALGIGGLIPFAACAAAVVMGNERLLDTLLGGPIRWPDASALLHGYAVVILAFMGGAQWGLTTAADHRDGGPGALQKFGYLVSVLPALLAWVALFIPGYVGLFVLLFGFTNLLAYDLWTIRALSLAPAWYARLRILLSEAVAVCLVAAMLSDFLNS